MADDPMLREMTCDPEVPQGAGHRRQDARWARRWCKALVKAGADLVWVGHAEPWKKLPRPRGASRAAAGRRWCRWT